LSIKARAIDTTGGFESLLNIPGGTPGARPGTTQVSGVCPVIIWYPYTNAKARGKTFLPCVTNTDLIDGIYQAAYRTAIVSFVNNFLPDMVLAGGGTPTAKFVVRQTKPTLSYLPVQYGTMSSVPGTLRKRQRPA